MTDDLITDHPYTGELRAGASCQYMHRARVPQGEDVICGQQAMQHANPGSSDGRHLLHTHPHEFLEDKSGVCAYTWPPLSVQLKPGGQEVRQYCGYPERLHHYAERDRAESAKKKVGQIVRLADAAQYERQPMPDAARRGPVVTLIDAPVDPLGTLAVIGGIYTGQVARSKAEVTDEQRRQMLADMQSTTLDGPLEAIQFTFLVEGVSRAFTHQAVRNRFSFFAQESLRFAVAEDWAQEVPLPPALSSAGDEDPAVGMWRKALNQAEDAYNALIGAGMPAEEARGVLPHAITTRYYWTVSLRTLLQEAGKRTCTQAQFDWRIVMAGVAKALREYGARPSATYPREGGHSYDQWQYNAFADLIRPVCYQQGKCGFMAKFDRGCTIRQRVDAFEREGVPSVQWHKRNQVVSAPLGGEQELHLEPINPAEWAADPAAARTKE